LTPTAIDALLRDFRAWLTDLASAGEALPPDSEQPDSYPPRPVEPEIDLFALVGQFTALRHEVNLQTKAARTAVEQNAEVLKHLAAIREPADDSDELRPMVKAIIDIADALALSLRQMEKFRDSVEPLLADVGRPPARALSFFGRLFGARPAPPDQGREERTGPAVGRIRQLAAAAADGYSLSLRRVERVLPTFQLDPVSCAGEVFDPEQMEVVEVVSDPAAPTGTVVETVRPGYRWRGKVFRFAQVKVAR
jgi:molecular chaperone GrpE